VHERSDLIVVEAAAVGDRATRGARISLSIRHGARAGSLALTGTSCSDTGARRRKA
jgi:hypothetical protein